MRTSYEPFPSSMSTDVVIRAEGLGKRYLIGHQAERERYVALRDVITRSAASLARSVRDVAHGRPTTGLGGSIEEFWALKDVNFEVRRGEVVGIIGRNGAGKSTLLKVLSRITEPTEGQVTIKGRVGSLLEVGTGFHPELTGRENIYLNGAILGMSRAEIRAKFDEIVAFAEVEKFLDTPVKRYSSGMYVRLAFAVAAHLEPEILVVDEVLAVGDVEFQKKCLGKMQDVAGHGRTVLFVSHNMGAVAALCGSALLLQKGRLIAQGTTDSIVGEYLRSGRDQTKSGFDFLARVSDELVIERLECTPEHPVSGTDLQVRIVLKCDRATEIFEAAVLLYTSAGQRVGIVDLRRDALLPRKVTDGLLTITIDVRKLPLVDGDYTIGLYVVTDTFAGNILDIDTLSIQSSAGETGFVPYGAANRGFVEFDAVAYLDQKHTDAMNARAG